MALSGCKTLADAGPALLWPGTPSAERTSR
jgi:hypothetical protein